MKDVQSITAKIQTTVVIEVPIKHSSLKLNNFEPIPLGDMRGATGIPGVPFYVNAVLGVRYVEWCIKERYLLMYQCLLLLVSQRLSMCSGLQFACFFYHYTNALSMMYRIDIRRAQFEAGGVHQRRDLKAMSKERKLAG